MPAAAKVDPRPRPRQKKLAECPPPPWLGRLLSILEVHIRQNRWATAKEVIDHYERESKELENPPEPETLAELGLDAYTVTAFEKNGIITIAQFQAQNGNFEGLRHVGRERVQMVRVAISASLRRRKSSFPNLPVDDPLDE
jgi:hypothetical protein